jgi:hypothetical protein
MGVEMDRVASYTVAEHGPKEESSSGISWAAILAGASVAAALSFSLMALGAGMGLSSVTPWPTLGRSASRAAPIAILWIILVQAVSCALGGYLAGRLRTKWATLHSHEVYFRDTAHGFLVWAVGLVISVFFLSSIGLTIAREGATFGSPGRNDYYVDQLFRGGQPGQEAGDLALRDEAREILAAALRAPEMQRGDQTYLAGLVAARSGLTQEQAQARVSSVLEAERQALDRARKAVAHSLYWLFAALLIGAFCASFAATLGGRRRDRAVYVPA